MTYDCFPFFNELDLLEIRMNELDGVVDRFVIAEAELTHNGDRKPLHFAENRQRFEKFARKIIHIVVKEADFSPAASGATFQERAWMRENIQRNAISRALAEAAPEDVVIVSDLDEIPRAESVVAVTQTLRDGEVVGFTLNAYNFYLNLRNASDPFWGNDPKMATVRTFRDEAAYATAPYSHFVLRQVNAGPTPTRFRYIKPARRIPAAGWHFSYLGGAQAAVAKVRAFNEVGLFAKKDLETFVAKRIAEGRALFGGDRYLPEPIDTTFPAFVVANQDRFENLIVKCHSSGVKMRFLRFWYRQTAKIRRLAMHIAFILSPKCLRTLVKKAMGIAT